MNSLNLTESSLDVLFSQNHRNLSSIYNQNNFVDVTFIDFMKKVYVSGSYYSNGTIVCKSGYFLKNDKHRYRRDGNDVNYSYYKERMKLLHNNYVFIEKIIPENKFYSTESEFEIYRIQKEVMFKSIVYATSTILGNWVSEVTASSSWRLNNMPSMKIADII